MISSTFLPPSLHLTEKTEIFPEFLHIQFLSPFPFPEATLPRPVCLLAGPPVAPLVGPPAGPLAAPPVAPPVDLFLGLLFVLL